ncbi:MAG: hypothetical protein AAGE03_05465 [Pseudomonadota bacterium]
MTEPLATAPATVGPGEIRFYDRIAPPLKAGAHQLDVKQTITGLSGVQPDPFTAPQGFDVTAPRFRISPGSIQQVYPPANHIGGFDGALPSIVLKEFALPWMRTVDPKAQTDDPRPWVGLLTLAGDELPRTPAQEKALAAAVKAGRLDRSALADPSAKTTEPRSIPVAEFVKPTETSVLPPALGPISATDGDTVLATDMDIAFFRQIAPTGDELGYLAHGRVVNTDGKVILGMDEDGAFSVVTGNRMTTNGAKNTVYLVSYEGHLAHLPGGDPIPAGIETIRLAVLGQWSYQATAVPGGFLQLMEELCSPGRGGVGLLRMPEPATSAPKDAMAKEALSIGYVALQNDLRAGEVTTSFYRGPLVPQPTIQNTDYGPYYVSDHAIHYDPDYGLFSMGYAAAWQIGRLMALSDAAFVRQVIDWRRAYAKAVTDAADATQIVAPVAQALLGTSPRPAPPDGAAPSLPEALRAAFSDRLSALVEHLPVIQPRSETMAPRDTAPLARTIAPDADEDPLHALRRRLREEDAP